MPWRFPSNNGGEFINELFRNISELLNVEVASAAVELLWSNVISKRHSAMIRTMVDKILNWENAVLK